ncbi:6-bladed beta-propeller [Proteiniphilum sp. UBA1028]|jgi:hypothetical protein|uniref:6-bladed beta-propeller n=1 Tax=Proteiniphilum sp. UBA1028 TaxID=1947251 RepID=UPI0025F24ADD|nr:6-bladed beta-propeller [Proteiniphilum sp. UBA1028]
MNHVNHFLKGILPIIIGGMLLFLSSCIENNKTKIKKDDRVYVNMDVANLKIFDIKNIADSAKYIPLETNNQSLITSISKLYVKDDSIIIFDRKNKNILLFDEEGKFIRKIGEKGSGPSEYIEFNDIYYDFDANKIYAFERFQSKMFVYLLNGNIDEIINSRFSFNSFIKTKKGFWIYSCFKNNNPSKFNLIYSDNKLSKIENGFFPQKDFVNITNETCFSEDNDHNKYFYYPTSNIIYKLNNNKVEPFVEINFIGRNLPYEKITQARTIDEYNKIINTNNYVGFIENLHILNNICVFNCSESNLNKSIMTFKASVDIANGEASVYNGYKNAEGSPGLNRLLYVTNKNELVYAINPAGLMDQEIDGLKKILPSISFDSNPVLVFYKIKH